MKLLYAAIVALLGVAFALPANALNLRQNQNGTADWVSQENEQPEFARCAGGVTLTFSEFGLTSLLTRVAVSPLSRAMIRNVQVGIPSHHSTAQTGRISIYAGSQTTFPLQYHVPGTTRRASSAEVHVYSRGTAGLTFGISSRAQAGLGGVLASNRVIRGDPIFLQSNGGWSVGTITPHAMVYLCPY